MLTVNTDPAATSLASAQKAEESTPLKSLPGWHFLTGTIQQLDPVWKAYGVTIEMQASTQIVSHNDVLDFIDPEGRLLYRATPFGNESSNGTFSLAPGTEKLFASGIADTARYVLGDGDNLLSAAYIPSRPAGYSPRIENFSETSDTSGEEAKPPFYKKRAVIVTTVIVAILAVTVVTDLPQSQTRGAQISEDTAIMKEVNSDLAPCEYAANESFTIWKDQESHALSPSEISRVPGLLRDDQTACSFTSDSIYDLTSNVDVPQTPAGKSLGQMVGTVTLWATSDALSAIESIQTLTSDPGNGAAFEAAEKEGPILASDRARADHSSRRPTRSCRRRFPHSTFRSARPAHS